MADGTVTSSNADDQRVNDILANWQTPPVETSDAPLPSQLEVPQQTDPAAGIHPAVMAEIQARQQGQQGPPQQGTTPLLMQYLGQMFGGEKNRQASPLSRPESRGDATLNFMGQFLANMSQGLQDAGHGPGANLRGFAGATLAPHARDVATYQAQQAAQEAQSQQAARAATAAAQTPSIPFEGPNGEDILLPPAHIAQALAAGYRFKGTQTSSAAKVQAAGIAADAKKATANPLNQILTEANQAKAKGDNKTYTDKLAQAQQMAAATKGPGKDSEISLIQKAQAGGPDAEAAASAYRTLQQGRMAVRAASSTSRPMNYYDPEQQRNITMSASEAEARQKAGQSLIPAGTVPANTILQMQRAQSAIPAAIGEVENNLEAWDNPGDRAIFAKILKDTPVGAEPSSWFNNVLSQAATAQLSDKGQKAVTRLRRLNESLGSLRAISGLPSTAGSMMATIALLPGGTTPNSKMAKDQLEQIRQLVTQETGVPFLGGAKKSAPPVSSGGAYSPGNPFAPKK